MVTWFSDIQAAFFVRSAGNGEGEIAGLVAQGEASIIGHQPVGVGHQPEVGGDLGGADGAFAEGVADLHADERDDEHVTVRHRRRVDLATAHDPGLGGVDKRERVDDGTARRPPAGLAGGQDDVLPPRQGAETLRQAQPRATPHDDGVAVGDLAEMREILRDGPRHAHADAADAVEGLRPDRSEDGHHTETRPLITGCGS